MEGRLFAALELVQDRALLSKRLSRELVARVQKLRKTCGLRLSDKVEIFVGVTNHDAAAVQFLHEVSCFLLPNAWHDDAFVSFMLWYFVLIWYVVLNVIRLAQTRIAHEEEVAKQLSGKRLFPTKFLSLFAAVVGEEAFTVVGPAIDGVPAAMSLRIVLAGFCVVTNKVRTLCVANNLRVVWPCFVVLGYAWLCLVVFGCVCSLLTSQFTTT